MCFYAPSEEEQECERIQIIFPKPNMKIGYSF